MAYTYILIFKDVIQQGSHDKKEITDAYKKQKKVYEKSGKPSEKPYIYKHLL